MRTALNRGCTNLKKTCICGKCDLTKAKLPKLPMKLVYLMPWGWTEVFDKEAYYKMISEVKT